MGQSELSLLGYEDLEEFKSFFGDFADLFIDKPGYISKFKNFSWIDYALHSGAPNKNVILKHKNGTEVETQLLISEIPLVDDINGASSLYCVELGTKTVSNMQTLTESQNNPTALNIHTEQEDIDQNPHTKMTEESSSNTDNTEKLDEFLASDYREHETSEDKNVDLKNEIQEVSSKENSGDFKLHVEDSYDTKEENTIDSDFEDYKPQKDDKKEEEQIKLKVFLNEEDDEPKIPEDNSDDTEVQLSKPNHQKELETIDFTQIAEDTGMDLGDIAEFIGEFIGESEIFLQDAKNDTSDNNFIKNGAIQLKGISSNLKMKSITESLNSIVENCDNDTINQQLDIFARQIKSLEEQLL